MMCSGALYFFGRRGRGVVSEFGAKVGLNE